MKALSACVLLIVLLASSGIWLGRDPAESATGGATGAAAESLTYGPGNAPGKIERQRAALGMRRMLRGHESLMFSSIVIGRTEADGITDFRGQITVSGQTMPAYGRVRALCTAGHAAGRAQPGCWDLAYLEANGQAVDLAATGAGQQAPARDAVSAMGGPTASLSDPLPGPLPDPLLGLLPIVMAATRNTTEPPEPPEPLPPEPPDPREGMVETAEPGPPALPGATHRVARAVINTRNGPGTEHAIVTRLAEGATLALLEGRDGWGRFVVLEGTAQGRQVWAALTILDALAAGESP